MGEIKLERLLETFQYAREHYKKQDISEFRRSILLLGEHIYQTFPDIYQLKTHSSFDYSHHRCLTKIAVSSSMPTSASAVS